MEDFRLDKIEFENYKNYSNKQIIDLTTNRRFQEKTTEKKEWLTTKKNKYKKVIGIWGRNASGKSSIIEVIDLWKTVLLFLNSSYEETARTGITEIFNSHLFLVNKYKKVYNSEKFRIYSQFNDKDKPIVISLYFSTKKLSFRYTVEHQYNKNKIKSMDPNRLLNSERLDFLSSEEKYENVWLSADEDYRLYDLVRVFSYLNNKDESTSIKNELAYENFIKDKVSLKHLNFTSREKSNVILAWDVLMNFLDSFKILDETYDPSEEKILKRNFNRSFDGINSINFLLTAIYQGTTKSKKEIQRILLSFINCCDQNIEDVLITFVDNEGNRTRATFTGIVTRNNVTNFPEELSIGTLTFVDIMLQILLSEISEKNAIKYFFIDELGLNWHTNLSKKFIEKIVDESFGPRMFVIFTSHDPNIGDSLPTDSLYIINNENNIKRISDIENSNNNLKRKNEKFSYNYLNYVLDFYSTSPDLDDFDSLDNIFNEI